MLFAEDVKRNFWKKISRYINFFCLDILTNHWGHIVLVFLELYRQGSKAYTYFCEPILKCLILHLQEHLVEHIWYYIKLFLRWLQRLLKYWCLCKVFTANEEDSPTFLTLNPCPSVEVFLLKWFAWCCLGCWQARNTAPLWQHLFTVLIGWLFSCRQLKDKLYLLYNQVLLSKYVCPVLLVRLQSCRNENNWLYR